MIPKHLNNAEPHVIIHYLDRENDRLRQKNMNRRKALQQAMRGINKLKGQLYGRWGEIPHTVKVVEVEREDNGKMPRMYGA